MSEVLAFLLGIVVGIIIFPKLRDFFFQWKDQYAITEQIVRSQVEKQSKKEESK